MQNFVNLLRVLDGPGKVDDLEEGWIVTQIADSVRAVCMDDLPAELREFVELIQGLDFIQLVALLDIARRFWEHRERFNGEQFPAAFKALIADLGLELCD